jgi:penicillin-binding protein 1A
VDNFISRLKNLSTTPETPEPLRAKVMTPMPRSKPVEGAESANPPAKPSAKPLSRRRRPAAKGKRPPSKAVRGLRQVLRGLFKGAAVTHQAYKRQPPKRQRLILLALVAATGGAGLAAGSWNIERSLPSTKDIDSFVRDGTLTIRSSDGVVLQQTGPATRDKVGIAQMPKQVVNAFVAAEDRRFYQHNGVDFQSIARAAVANVMARDVLEGGSTLTQQLSRIVYLKQERSLWRKFQEAFLAQKIDRELTKEQILEKYLNLVYLGSNAYGVADAAWVYFSKTVDQLTLSETAMIAGLPPAPSNYSPEVNPAVAQERRNIVLARMRDEGFISPEEAERAKAEPLKLKLSQPKKLNSDTPYFTSHVKQEMGKLLPQDVIEQGGLTVETTLNSEWQKIADKAIQDTVVLDGPGQGFEQASLVAIDPKTGEIRAMVGGGNFNKTQFNRATQAQRQPGSTFKPLLYATAIASGMSPHDGFQDAPYSVDGYKPKNYGNKYSGWMTMKDALTNSVNIISVKLIVETGFDPVIKMAHDMGIKSKMPSVYALALGASEVNALEITSAYGTLAAKGEHREAHAIKRVINRKGEVIYNADGKFGAKRALDADSAAITTWMMQSVVNNGTGQAAYLNDRQVAGKTGTSEKARDLWFIGFIPQLVTSVWLGNDDNAPTYGASSTAAAVWHDFMSKVTKGMPVEKFAELPKLEGRKGSIKAKPIKNVNAYTLSAPPKDDDSSYSGGRSSRRYEDDGYGSGYSGGSSSGSSSGGGGSSYYDEPQSSGGGGGGSSSSYEPEPSYAEPAAPEPAPAPAPAAAPEPEPELPPAEEPAAPAPSGAN